MTMIPYQPPYWPPFWNPTPYLPKPANPPTWSDTTFVLNNKKERKMDVYIIWAITPDKPDAPWVISAWDGESRAGNEDGFNEALASAEETWGGRYVRVTRTSVNYDAVIESFQPKEV